MKGIMNKKIVLLGMLLISILALFVMSAQDASAAPSLRVTLSKYEPYPASPGQTVKVWLLVQNTGNQDAENVRVELVPQYPFTLYGDNPVKTIPLLGQNKDYLIEYTLKVDENAVQGNNQFTVAYSDAVSQNVRQETVLQLYVQSRDATLVIDSVTAEPTEISPGGQGTLTIRVKNTAPTTLHDITMKLYFYAANGATVSDLPFIPVESTTEKMVYQISPGETVDFKYNVRVYPDAQSKLYKIPFTMTYYDSLGTQKNKSDYIGVVVNSVPDVSVMIDKTDLSMQKKQGTLTLKFVNKGLSDIKFLNVDLEPSEEYELLSTSSSTYIGNLVSDDYQTAEYSLSINSAKNSVDIPVTLQYRDANNKYYERTENVHVSLIDGDKLGKAQGQGSSAFLIVVIVVILGIGAWIYLRRRSKKNKKAQFN